MPSLGMFTKLLNMLKRSIRMRGWRKAHHIPRDDRRYLLVTSLTTSAESKATNFEARPRVSEALI